ncbi:hypothetical protein X743_30315 [Mesorhizobium sp. LNHC252B00]|nr:hypothetical protein X743_30315 [Mesorhizobium sp. LNHC252B00]
MTTGLSQGEFNIDRMCWLAGVAARVIAVTGWIQPLVGRLVHHSDRGVQGGFKRSSQHSEVGGCDEHSKATIGTEQQGKFLGIAAVRLNPIAGLRGIRYGAITAHS